MGGGGRTEHRACAVTNGREMTGREVGGDTQQVHFCLLRELWPGHGRGVKQHALWHRHHNMATCRTLWQISTLCTGGQQLRGVCPITEGSQPCRSIPAQKIQGSIALENWRIGGTALHSFYFLTDLVLNSVDICQESYSKPCIPVTSLMHVPWRGQKGEDEE